MVYRFNLPVAYHSTASRVRCFECQYNYSCFRVCQFTPARCHPVNRPAQVFCDLPVITSAQLSDCDEDLLPAKVTSLFGGAVVCDAAGFMIVGHSLWVYIGFNRYVERGGACQWFQVGPPHFHQFFSSFTPCVPGALYFDAVFVQAQQSGSFVLLLIVLRFHTLKGQVRFIQVFIGRETLL